ncbi:sensor domain-containing diguanylate cyclase [Peribacillus alkalitolerans]|uniref:sensor domain-containing diguanylate cyclase n=1 Tax=Peribacillus alkalitolerans TaxID=1550385 RepID=UPI0013D86DB0|nr:sensor domain-containing diguanylate cyclase [Peribacillus alkalitolerans]
MVLLTTTYDLQDYISFKGGIIVGFTSSENQKILNMINHLLKDIQSGNSSYHSFNKSFFNNIDDSETKGILESIFEQLFSINAQMENMSWLNKHYRILHEFGQICSKTLDESTLLQNAYEMVSKVMPTESFFIALYNEAESQIKIIFLVEHGEIFPEITTDLGDNYISKVIRSRKIIHQNQASELKEFDAVIGDETCSCIFVPVIIDDHVKGVISAQSFRDFAYRKEHEDLLQIIGTQVINSIETARLYEKIYTMSQTDELTGLKNQRAFHNDLEKLLEDKNKDIKLIMLDSDNLKNVNDNYGHDVGDLYLKVLADGINSISNNFVTGYRYAGDEFLIIIRGERESNIDQIYENLNHYYFKNPIKINNKQIFITFSSGVAYYPLHGNSVDSLKKAADKALYVAKKQGKNQQVIAGDETDCDFII